MLGTWVRKDQLTAEIPRKVTYPTITARITIEIDAHIYMIAWISMSKGLNFL